MKKPKVINHKFPENQYYQEITEKKQVVLHHTVSGDSADGDISWWEQTPERVATCIIVTRDGTIHTLYSSEKWAHHLGVRVSVFDKNKVKRKYKKSTRTGKMYVSNNVELNQGAIGLEIDSWGGLVKKGNNYYNAVWKNGGFEAGRNKIDADKVIDYGSKIRGFRYYERYTDEQIASTEYLLKYWNKKYKVPLDYKEDMWDVSKNALTEEPGIWTHVSYRPDKSDCHPYPPLIDMLKSLTK